MGGRVVIPPGSMPYGNGTNVLSLLSRDSNGSVLVLRNGLPSWGNADSIISLASLLPDTAGNAGKVLGLIDSGKFAWVSGGGGSNIDTLQTYHWNGQYFIYPHANSVTKSWAFIFPSDDSANTQIGVVSNDADFRSSFLGVGFVTAQTGNQATSLIGDWGLQITTPHVDQHIISDTSALCTGVTFVLPDSAGSPGQVLMTNGGFPTDSLSWTTPSGGLVNWIDSLNTSAPNATVHVVAFVANNSATNVDAVVQPKGTGALLAQIPNNATSGGNKRGTHAVDLQTSRTSATLVASGNNSVISGGINNIASGLSSVVSGGGTNQALNSYATVAGGNLNEVDLSGGTVSGGVSNRVNATTGTISGGANNVETGGNNAFIGGGSGNSANGNYSVIAGGLTNEVDGALDAIIGGEHLQLSGSGSFGFNSFATGMSVSADSVGVIANTNLWLANNKNVASSLVFYAPSLQNNIGATKYVGFQAGAITTSQIWVLPLADGSVGQLLGTDGAGNLSWVNPGGTGTVTSVALSLPAIFSVSGSPVTTTGTLTATLASQSQNLFFASPNGSSGAPAFRAIALADLPSGYQYYSWASNATTSFAASVGSAYNTTAGSQATVTLPSATDNQRVLVKGNNTGGWIITLSAQTIHFPGQDYTTSIASTDGSVELIYNAATSKWDVISMTGTITPL